MVSALALVFAAVSVQAGTARTLDSRVALVLEREDTTPRTVSRRFRALVEGVEIDRARVVQTFDHAGRAVFFDSDVPAFGAVVRGAPTDAELWALAARAVPGALADARGAPLGGLSRAWFAVKGALHAGAWVFVPTARESENWHVAVDATDGRVLAVQNRVYRAALDARVYAPSPGGLDAGVGATPTVAVQLVRGDGGPMLAPDASVLEGAQLSAFNCCLTAGCAEDAGPKVVTNYLYVPDAGFFGADGGDFDWDAGRALVRTVVCDRLHLASNDPARHQSGDFVYPPVDGPAPLQQSAPEYSDPFSEVHAFFHANRMLEWVEGLSDSGFTLRDARREPPLPLLVQTNFVEADPQSDTSAGCLLLGICTWTRFGPIGNAMFVPREQYGATKLPELFPDRDGVYFFQGPVLDFAYDATVVRHEFGHAVVQATAGLRFGAPRVESTWASDERGALNEGLADFLAAAHANNPDIGRYLGPNRDRTADGPLRSVQNRLRCPDSLEGTIHEDGAIFAGALWQGRALVAPERFDAAVYAALLMVSPSVDFDTAGLAVVAALELDDAAAATTLRAIFLARGALGCTHLRDADGGSFSAAHFGLAAPPLDAQASFGPVPGPYQVQLEPGARGGTVEVHATQAPSGVRVLVRRGTPVTFSALPSGLAATADAEARLEPQGAFVPIACGDPQPVYVALTNTLPWPQLVEGLSLQWVPDDRCPLPDVSVPRLDAAWPASKACGCGSAPLGPLVGLGLLALRRRHRRA